ncbi:MAG: hypothetical protein Q9226_007915 [Calogaya cf. arnoldii]
MPSSEALTDDYVAQLLAKDAKDRTIKYSSYGLQAILPKRITNGITADEGGITKTRAPRQKQNAPAIVDLIVDATTEAPLPTTRELDGGDQDKETVHGQDRDQDQDPNLQEDTSILTAMTDPTTNDAIPPPRLPLHHPTSIKHTTLRRHHHLDHLPPTPPPLTPIPSLPSSVLYHPAEDNTPHPYPLSAGAAAPTPSIPPPHPWTRTSPPPTTPLSISNPQPSTLTKKTTGTTL